MYVGFVIIILECISKYYHYIAFLMQLNFLTLSIIFSRGKVVAWQVVEDLVTHKSSFNIFIQLKDLYKLKL